MSFELTRQRRELIYSLFLIIVIPASIIGSTLWLTQRVKDNFDLELRRKANLANEIVGVQVSAILSSSTHAQAVPLLQDIINQTRIQAPELDALTVSVPVADGLQVLASSKADQIGKADEAAQSLFAYSHAQPVASLVSSDEGNTREWLVATPVLSRTGSLIALTTARVSLAAADATMNATLKNSYILLAVITVGVILLLLNHFKFVAYAELFRTQKELDQLKDDFISIATHELKSPMSVIKGYISMTLEEKLPKTAKDMLTIALDQTDRLARLVHDLLDVSRLEQGKTKFSISNFDLPTIIDQIVNVYQSKATDKKLTLEYAHGDVSAVTADPDRAQEVFTNLIDNAIKYSRTGTIVVTHSLTPHTVVTTVKDTGIGMTPDEVSHLFARFYRARNDDNADIEGTGLGLWIIKQYIEKMGGTISVDSQKGVGSSFIVTLPRAVSKEIT